MITHCFDLLRVDEMKYVHRRVALSKNKKRNDVIIMFNNYDAIDHNEFEFVNDNTRAMYVIEMIVNAQFATCFDDIYTMHIYQNNRDSNDFIVDVAFELNTHMYYRDDENDLFEMKHNYDMRVKMYIENIDVENIVQSIDENKLQYEIVHRNAYTTRDYDSHIFESNEFTF